MSVANNKVYFNKVALIGVGLIGGSLIQALRQKKAVAQVVGVGRSQENLALAQSLGVIDTYTLDIQSAVVDADLIIFATPISAIEALMLVMMPALDKDAIVTDVSSTKADVIRMARRAMAQRSDQFVPAHPIAGAEKSGVAAAFPHLFLDHKIILTPTPETRPAFLSKMKAMWALTGATCLELEADLHDQVLGVTSHLPHVIVYALMDYLSQQKDQSLYFQFAAGGLFDLTRIASSDATMWRDVCLSNQQKLAPIIREFAQSLNAMADKIEANEGEALAQIFTKAKVSRSQIADYRKPQSKQISSN